MVAVAGALLVWWLLASPLRGRWSGDFDGSVSGTVEFEIGVRGNSASGRMVGTTSSGEPFRAEIEGRVSGDQLVATFVGSGRGGPLGVQFRGVMEGTLDATGRGPGNGVWRCVLERGGQQLSGELEGSWSVARPPPS